MALCACTLAFARSPLPTLSLCVICTRTYVIKQFRFIRDSLPMPEISETENVRIRASLLRQFSQRWNSSAAPLICWRSRMNVTINNHDAMVDKSGRCLLNEVCNCWIFHWSIFFLLIAFFLSGRRRNKCSICIASRTSGKSKEEEEGSEENLYNFCLNHIVYSLFATAPFHYH